MTQILIAESNGPYAEGMAEFLMEMGHGTKICATAAAMWETLSEGRTGVVVLDLGLPDEDGFSIIPRMRQLHPDIGLLVLTARVAFDNRILGLRLGADHYLSKPIKFSDLAAHIESLVRRVRPDENSMGQMRWVLRITERRLELKGHAIDLTEKECNFLHLLALNTQPVPRESLLNRIGEEDLEAGRRIDMLVYRLRKKTKSGLGENLPLRTAYGEGYSLSRAFNLV